MGSLQGSSVDGKEVGCQVGGGTVEFDVVVGVVCVCWWLQVGLVGSEGVGCPVLGGFVVDGVVGRVVWWWRVVVGQWGGIVGSGR